MLMQQVAPVLKHLAAQLCMHAACTTLCSAPIGTAVGLELQSASMSSVCSSG